MTLKENVIYKVTKSSKDGTVMLGDRVAVDSFGRLWKDRSSDGFPAAWIDKEDLLPDLMSFEVEQNEEVEKV